MSGEKIRRSIAEKQSPMRVASISLLPMNCGTISCNINPIIDRTDKQVSTVRRKDAARGRFMPMQQLTLED